MLDTSNSILNRLEEIAPMLPIPIYWLDLNGIFLGANEAVVKAVGYKTIEQLLGKTYYHFHAPEIAKDITQHDKEVMQTKKILRQEETIINSVTGEVHYYQTVKMPLYSKGKTIGLIGVLMEITEQKNNEHVRLEAVKKSSIVKYFEAYSATFPVPVYWNDLDNIIMGGNEHTLRSAGVQSAHQFIGKNIYELYPKKIADKIAAHNEEVIRTGRILSQEEEIRDIVTGKAKYFNAYKAPLRDEEGEIIGILGISIDITAEKEAERLQLENERQQIILQEREEFRKIVGQAVHDIGSPLTSLGIMLEIGLDLPEEDRNTLREIATRINDIAANLLTYYRPKHLAAEAMTEKRKPVLISLALLTLLAEKRYQYQGKQVSFETDFQPGCYFIFAELEESAFKRMLSNLINNAVEALEQQPGVVTLSFSVDNGVIKIAIQDSGKGMSEELVNKIINNIMVTEGKENGYGIGLEQVRETVKRNQGTFTIDSKIDQGTTITLAFPGCHKPGWIAKQITLNSRNTVVILDDEPTIHAAWAAHFNMVATDIALKHFTQANEAIEFINEFAFKEQIVLLTDYELLNQPYNGLEVIEQVQINHAVLVTSHYADPDIQQQAIQSGITILPKQLAAEIPIQLSD